MSRWKYGFYAPDYGDYDSRHRAVDELVPMLRDHPWLDVKHAASWVLPFTEVADNGREGGQ